MNDYAIALARHLASDDVRQYVVAQRAERSQAAISRYATGARFPDLATARLIEAATDGAVPVSLWQGVAMRKLGLAA